MGIELQKASMWKRISAWLLDIILLSIVAVGAGLLLSWMLGYNSCNEALDAGYAKYETQYGVTFDITAETYNAMTAEERQNYDAAYSAMIADDEVIRVYNLVLNLTLVITTLAILLAYLILEFAVPLLFGNGQTLGKKVFALCLVRNDGVKVNTLQLFTRFLLGKFAVGVMIPVYSAIMILLNVVKPLLLLLAVVILAAQVICFVATRNNCLLHDLMAGTVVVDYGSQQIFKTTDDLIAHQQRIAAERAARQKY